MESERAEGAAPAAAQPPTAPFIGTERGALPPATRPRELPPPREPRLRTWHMPPPAAPEGEEPQAPPVAPEAPARPGVPWEVEAMTSPDYNAPRSIHDPEHDSWPVATPDGTVAPAWTDEDETELQLTETVETQPAQLELTDVVAEEQSAVEAGQVVDLDLVDVVDTEAPTQSEAPGDSAAAETTDVPYVDAERPPDTTFPLDAFIVPRGVEHVPAGYAEEIGAIVADRLEALARQIRTDGIQSLGKTDDPDELAHVLAALVTGYVARRV